MDSFLIFLQMGIEHILDIHALDHLLFILVLVVDFSRKEIKQLTFIITSFTIAHSTSLLLSVLDIISVNQDLIEKLILLTIAFTALENMFFPAKRKYKIYFAFLFGLIHGYGFSSYLKMMFMKAELNLFTTLLPFNLGIEIAQLIVVFIALILLSLIPKKHEQNIRQYFINGAVFLWVIWAVFFWV